MSFLRKLTQRIFFGNEKAQRLNVIMQRGGPQSLEDYLFLFPEACPKCGSREIVDYEESEYLGHRHKLPVILVKTGRACARCKHDWNTSEYQRSGSAKDEDDINNNSLPKTWTPRRVYSPYLSRKESESISDLALV
jgi:hypothetical protein